MPRQPTIVGNPVLMVIDIQKSAFLESQDGALWVGTWGGGLNHFDPRTGVFTRYRHDPGDLTSLSNDQVRTIYEDRQGTLWVGTLNGFAGTVNGIAGGFNNLNRIVGSSTNTNDDLTSLDADTNVLLDAVNGNTLTDVTSGATGFNKA